MARKDMAGLFNVNRSVTSLGGESRPLRLPTMSQFPKLNQKGLRTAAISAHDGVAVIGGLTGSLPEMTTDVLDLAADYAVENVKRDQKKSRSSMSFGLGNLVERMWGSSHRAARP
jgi:hypothetical protein